MSSFYHHSSRGALAHWGITKLVLWPIESWTGLDLSGVATFSGGIGFVIGTVNDLVPEMLRKMGYSWWGGVRLSLHYPPAPGKHRDWFEFIPATWLHYVEDLYIWHRFPDGHWVKVMGEVLSYPTDLAILWMICR